jgi:hypothetical protein
MAVGEVAYDAGIALKNSGFVMESHADGVGPESGAVLSGVPGFTGGVPFPDGAQEFTFQADEEPVFGRIEERQVNSEDFLSFVAVHPFGAAVPRDDAAMCVQKAKGVVLRPLGNFLGGDTAP